MQLDTKAIVYSQQTAHQYTALVLLLYLVHLKPVQLFTVVNVDCNVPDTAANSCFIETTLVLDPAARLNFTNVSNASAIHRLKLVTATNASNIPNEIFEYFSNLQHLELTIGLENLCLESFPGGRKLKYLNLSDNKIHSIRREAFIGAVDLVEINLQHNQIQAIEDGAFVGLSKLMVLILFANKLTILQQTIFGGASNIKNLDLACNEIAIIENGAFDLPNLEEILISGNKLTTLSDQIFNGAPNLQNIDLRKNHLETIGRAFDGLQRLHQLQLSDNRQLRDLDIIAFSALPTLISLGAEETGLTHLSLKTQPNTLSTVSSSPLTTLSLSRNQLSETDFLRKLSIFSKLEKLFVDSNAFSRWDEADIVNVKNYFPNIDLIVTKDNAWDRKWVENTLIPVFNSNNIYCNQFKFLGVYIFGFTKGGDRQVIEGTECI